MGGFLIRAAAQGHTTLSPAVAARLVTHVRRPGPDLTGKETEILQLLARGLSNRQIARDLHISEATVKTHLAHIYAKLGVDTRTAAVTTAVEQRLIRIT